jgi:hypothetical protein
VPSALGTRTVERLRRKQSTASAKQQFVKQLCQSKENIMADDAAAPEVKQEEEQPQ